ncbi:hypothetical protein [Rubrivirga sp.]|uniref:hypothetical protein n=1 Tax=Rubrivirga sp. TaxID=1885344 RepID=UPI003B51C44A
MGQQQLLLLVLSIVIVGVAIAAGITMFDTAARQNQADDVLNRNVRIAQEAVNWRGRSTIHGGGGSGSYEPLSEDAFEKMGVEPDVYATRHAVLSATGTTVEIVGVSTAAPGVGAYVRVEGNEIVESRTALDGSITLTSAGD